VAAVVVAAMAAGGWWLHERAEAARQQTSIAPPKPRVAILPFDNLSPDPANAFFTDGLHEEILTALANGAPELEVISRTTMESYKGKQVTVRQLAKDLVCDYVLEGSVRREGADVRLTLQLIDARTDGHVWARNYDRKLVSAITLQGDVAGEVATQLSVKLGTGPPAARARTNDPRAYDFYLKARLAREPLSGNVPAADWLSVAQLATRAIEIDPTFVLAYVERFGAYFYLHMQYPDADGGLGRLAQSDLDVLRRLEPDAAAVLGAEAEWAFAQQDFAGAEAFFARARAAGLTDPNLLAWEITLHQFIGDFDHAAADFDRVVAVDPGNVAALLIAGLNFALARRPRDALHVFDLALAKTPESRLLQLQRPFLEFEMTGNDAARDRINQLQEGLMGVAEPDHFVTFRWTSDYEHVRDRVDRESARELRLALFGYLPVFGGVSVPIEWLRGQLDRQIGDVEAATKDGRAVVAYVSRQTETKWNAWLLRYLVAEGRFLQGDKAGALAAARESLTLSPDGGSGIWPVAPFLAATVLAGAGAEDDAAALLEKIAFSSPGIMPAEITRTAEIDVPLANNARYRALKTKLEAQMAESAKLFAAEQ
jgi:TolB-like protein/tetratricopeptide (TPR) repeat protein